MGAALMERDGDRFWLDAEKYQDLDGYWCFYDLDGTPRYGEPRDFDIFKHAGDWYEVQGYDRFGRRWWCERIEPPSRAQILPAGKSDDPRGLCPAE